MKLNSSTSSAVVLLSGLAALLQVQAATLTFVNSCDHQIGLYDNSQESPLAPGASQVRPVGEGYRGMFRAGKNPQATLAEFTFDGGKLWYDISIIPTSVTKGPEFCPSLEACKQLTGGTGYNEPMQIAPQSNTNGAYCRVLTCLNDGCEDAYQFPKDDTKTHNCPDNTDFVVTFCPGAARAAAPALTPAPTQTPVIATTPPTQAPTTQPPTAAPTPATAAPEANTASNTTSTAIEIGGEADSNSNSSSASVEANVVVSTPVVTSESPAPAATTPTPTEASTATATEPPATEANTQSAPASSATTSVLVVGALAVAAAAAAVVIVVARRKKRELGALTEKSPIMNPGLATL
ncbi:hypothetical protein Gpo141_00003938 [Globisporangium polare]